MMPQVFKETEIQKFIFEAEDLTWLDVKVAWIFGMCGATRPDDLTRITMDDVEKHGDLFLVKLQQTKTQVSSSFTINNGGLVAIVQKYINLRPARVATSDRFFTAYQQGNCTPHFIEKKTFCQMPRRTAEYLGLPDAEKFTGRAFRRTSAAILATNGADIVTIMRQGRWRANRL